MVANTEIPVDPPRVTVTRTRRTVGVNTDGAISLLELTRMIELYNHRVGQNRTGDYRVQTGTEDGFAGGR